MKQSKFSESQIVSIIKEYESGVAVTDICRRHGVHPKQAKRSAMPMFP